MELSLVTSVSWHHSNNVWPVKNYNEILPCRDHLIFLRWSLLWLTSIYCVGVLWGLQIKEYNETWTSNYQQPKVIRFGDEKKANESPNMSKTYERELQVKKMILFPFAEWKHNLLSEFTNQLNISFQVSNYQLICEIIKSFRFGFVFFRSNFNYDKFPCHFVVLRESLPKYYQDWGL